jgi:uncharacterized damage-inducible protein DinB
MQKLMLTAVALAGPVLAQTTIAPSIVDHWRKSADFTIAVAKAMPAESYNYRPTPEEMSFGHVIAHIAAANAGACANASGTQRLAAPAGLAEKLRDEKSDVDRETALSYLTATFDFCNQAVDSMTPAKLDAKVGPTNRQMTGFEWLWGYFTHTAHHRGQAEVYLRLKGIKPPDYVF